MAGRPKSRSKKKSKDVYDPKRRNANRKALRHARNLALVEGEPEEDVDPVEALQHVLDRTFHMLKNAEEGVADLKPDEVWRDTQVGKIPNEWIRLEQDLRKEVAQLAARMLDLELEGRRTKAAEVMATLLAPVLEGILGELDLSPKQRRVAPLAVRKGLRLLEGGEKGSPGGDS